jgi:CBS domain-containing protein
MQRNGSSRLLVTEGDKLVGIITLTDLLEFLSLKNELEGFEESRLGALPSREHITGHISTDHLAGKI